MTTLMLALTLLSTQARVVINEVMANPRGGDSHAHSPEDRNEFVELFNLSDDTIDLRGWHLTDFDDMDTLCAWTDTMIRVKYAHVRMNSTLIYPRSFALVLDPEYTDPAPESGYVQPYRLSDRLLIVRPGNTTIGNGLSSLDPVMLCSRDWADSSTFGTPFISDTIPREVGDGLSWERTAPDASDCDTTWYACSDTAGCTPGRANSIATRKNLRLESIICYPLSYHPASAETIAVSIRNTGRVSVLGWSVRFYRDDNQNSREDPEERIAELAGPELVVNQQTGLTAIWPEPEMGPHIIAAELDCAGDCDTCDNRAVMPLLLRKGVQCFSLLSDRFGPNLRAGPESLTICYSLPDNKGNLSVRVYDLNGRERAIVFEGRPSARDGLLVWDGRGSTGSLLATGLYVVACEYKTGKTVILEKKTVVLAKGK